MASIKYALSLVSIFSFLTSLQAQVSIEQNDSTVFIKNEKVKAGFKKISADLIELEFKGKSLLHGGDQRAYLLGPGFSMSPSVCTVVRQTDSLIELSFLHKAHNHFTYDLHYIIKTGVAGVYCFLEQSHDANDAPADFGQTRWGIRGSETQFDYHLVRDSIQGPMPLMKSLKKENELQDWTYRLDDGTVYTKYNYADYISGRNVHGMAGTKSGLGMFVIQASHEYLNGGPTKQFQNVHSNPYLICMFNCGHFLSDKRKADNMIAGNWRKLMGPFLLYLNSGANTNAIWADAKKQAQKEMKAWPYSWMNNEDYPLERSSIQGRLMLNGKAVKPGTTIVLAKPGYDWQAQSGAYIYSTVAKADGSFNLTEVRPGNYSLYAYGSNQTEAFEQKNIQVGQKQKLQLGVLNWNTTPSNIIFQLGIADRTTAGFKYANHARTYGLFDSVPANIIFTIGKSKPETDWYYAQTKKGSWQIQFQLNEQPKDSLLLTIALAGAAKNPTVNVLANQQSVYQFKPGNDASIYRSAILGGYYQCYTIPVAANLLKTGENSIGIELPDVKNGGGLMYDAIKLEAKK